MSENRVILRIAIPSPLRQSFDYLPPEKAAAIRLVPGIRVQVPFNGKPRIGILLAVVNETTCDPLKLKSAIAVIDKSPLLPDTLTRLIHWACDYYQHPIGETYQVALPTLIQKGHPLPTLEETHWLLTDADPSCIPKRATRQWQIIDYLTMNASLTTAEMKQHNYSMAAVKTLETKGIVTRKTLTKTSKPITFEASEFTLDTQQQRCIDKFQQLDKGYRAILLEGITGSGKTEVYLELVKTILKRGQQALILVPEIGLTPQTLSRFQRRFGCNMAIFHSNLTDSQRLSYWQQARDGLAPIIIGTRSAIFTPCQSLGLIIVDEEHDLSYKQQDTLRYSARDLACVRGDSEQIPVILGSATPSLETLLNTERKRFDHWVMDQRAGKALSADIVIHDIRRALMVDGIAEPVLATMADYLEKNEQVLLFINRRGFAPALICHDCGWVHQCHACDAKLTIHQQANQSRCHHCGAFEPIPMKCPECHSNQLERQGTGTERLALRMQQHFPHIPCYRIDRDSTRGKNDIQGILGQLDSDSPAILIGTQMLAKGHHLPNVTLVVVIDADAGLMGTDYRSTERFGQLVTQVTGRSGRGEKPGKAIIQTHYPEHQQLLKLINFGFHRFAMDILAERKMLALPPFSYMALVRLEAMKANEALQILQTMTQVANHIPSQRLGPFAAGLARRAYYFRFQLIIRTRSRADLREIVKAFWQQSRSLIKSRHRFSIDIDPQDMS